MPFVAILRRLEGVPQSELNIAITGTGHAWICRDRAGEQTVRATGQSSRRIARPETVCNVVSFDSGLDPLAFADPEVPR